MNTPIQHIVAAKKNDLAEPINTGAKMLDVKLAENKTHQTSVKILTDDRGTKVFLHASNKCHLTNLATFLICWRNYHMVFFCSIFSDFSEMARQKNQQNKICLNDSIY